MAIRKSLGFGNTGFGASLFEGARQVGSISAPSTLNSQLRGAARADSFAASLLGAAAHEHEAVGSKLAGDSSDHQSPGLPEFR
jgi:hypothetical protein